MLQSYAKDYDMFSIFFPMIYIIIDFVFLYLVYSCKKFYLLYSE